MSSPIVYLHTSFRFETVSTNVTLESVFSLLWQSHGPTPGSTPPSVDTSTGTGFCLFFQEGLLAPGISPEGRRACLLIGLAWAVWGQTHAPCIKGELERGTNCEEEVEGQCLAGQPYSRGPDTLLLRMSHFHPPQSFFSCTSELWNIWRDQIIQHASKVKIKCNNWGYLACDRWKHGYFA